jgi:hypothetical protein
MKKLFIVLSLALCSTFAFAQTLIVNGAQVTLTNTTEIQLQFASLSQASIYRTAYVVVVQSVSGVQIGSGETITGSHYAWPTGSKVPISFVNGQINIRVKGNNTDIIAITY